MINNDDGTVRTKEEKKEPFIVTAIRLATEFANENVHPLDTVRWQTYFWLKMNGFGFFKYVTVVRGRY